MLRIAETFFKSDVGRQRHGNEDNFFVRAPLFVVADGMGGAQAGEVASALAVESFEPGLPDGSPEEGLVSIIQTANRKIHDMSRTDARRSGMGTTCTAIYVSSEEVFLAHVGDSRCYLYRDGQITRLTRDHSLVGELVDRGKLTEEQAEIHPQRSVITRALGPESEVRVDTERIAARKDDLFLLCSDGLTSMIREHTIVPILQESGSLEEAGNRLIAAANEAGGRDNITVILVRLDEASMAGAAADDQETVEAGAVAGEGAPAATAADTRATGDLPSPAAPAPSAPPPSAPPSRTAPPPRAKRRRPRFPQRLLVIVVLLALLLGGAFLASRAVFFIGTDNSRAVTIYRGLPYELPAGIKLYSRHFTSGATIDDVPASRRGAFTDHKLRSLDDASDLVRQAELGKLEE